jgi:RNA polymerase sigma-70 factor (ECF subfamily)
LTEPEEGLVIRAKRGDRGALAVILKSREHDLYISALAIVRSSWDAEDAVQETLYEACAKLHTLRKPARFSAWLARILVRKCYDQLRRRGSESLGQEHMEQVIDGSAHLFVGTERDDDVLEAVAALPDEQRLPIVLRFFLDLAYADIEMATGWPAGTVKSRISRGLSQLRETLGERILNDDLR